MMLGPGILQKKPLRKILRDSTFKKVLRRYRIKKLDWGDNKLAEVKRQLRIELRKQQGERCIYCRRRIKIERRNASEDIEHFLDKSRDKYRKWSFCCVNLSIACHACNLEKGTRDLGNTLVAPQGTISYARGQNLYQWIHPYFDDYHLHIEVGRGWTYKVKANAPYPVKAQQLIDDLKLIEVERIEAQAEAVKRELERLTDLAHKCLKKKKYRSAEIVIEASKQLQSESTFG